MGKQDLRRRNTHLLLSLLQSEGPNSQAELVRRSGLSAATVSGILQPLIESQFLVEERKSASIRGRRASILAFNPRKVLAGGVSIDHDGCDVALVDFSGRVFGRDRADYAHYTDANEVAALATQCFTRLLERNQMRRDCIAGVGVAAPGLINSRSGVVQVATNLGWRNVHLRNLFEQKLRLPVRVDHLGRAHVRAEAIWGQGRGHRNFICLEIGTGIGAGVMSGGRVLRGASGIAGEVGHIPIDLSGPRCACGLRGCWEALCAAPAIRGRLAARLEEGQTSNSALSATSTLSELNAAYMDRDPVAIRVIEDTANYLAHGLVAVIWTFDPEFILLTGSVVMECPSLIESAKSLLGCLKAARGFDVRIDLHDGQDGTGVVAASAIISSRYLEDLALNGVGIQPQTHSASQTQVAVPL